MVGWYDLVGWVGWVGMVWFGLVWLVWVGMVWFGLVWLVWLVVQRMVVVLVFFPHPQPVYIGGAVLRGFDCNFPIYIKTSTML